MNKKQPKFKILKTIIYQDENYGVYIYICKLNYKFVFSFSFFQTFVFFTVKK